ncbi:MAG: undecaprenyldiphospho-muramoylpentapeptide beta-N-acetylglucosaminyltransferase [Clostridiales Family XIII bacterium]|jgi:UDP-N-acetylglucosamine--N-acetylmuramyl-(pentapeptide) pyrophosphoryl-undecaprenol N-acetylglucosamine transferase|nr:undecaprenyldiphospho-muramoylpentapeptide beta-N-acetylglucosaminyltransferase [Clostridiales Family XIII bacterium]
MRVLLASSATGGHIYPALAIADRIRRRDKSAEILFVTAKKEVKLGIIERAGFRQTSINIRGFYRKSLLKNIATISDLVMSSAQVRWIFDDFRPDIVIGTGGYVCGPVIRLAKKMGIRAYLHEQNVLPGLANRLAERYADKVFVAFEESVPHFKDPSKVIVSGNPVRDAFLKTDKELAKEGLGMPADRKSVLIFGGSQGADALNAAAVETVDILGASPGYCFSVITGKRSYAGTEEQISLLGDEKTAFTKVIDYTESIYRYMAAADIIVSRAGALTVAEIGVLGRASILIPSPNVTGNHQYYNALTLSDRGAAVLMDEKNIAGGGLAAEIKKLVEAEGKLTEMGRLAAQYAVRDAADRIFDAIYEK